MRTSPITSLLTRRLFGLDFVADATIDDVVDVLLEEAHNPSGRWRCVVTPNVDHLVRYRRSDRDEAVARSSFIVLPDGMPILWASRLLRRPLRRRLAGSDLFVQLWPRLAANGVPTVVVAPNDRVADLLCREHPDVRCVIPPELVVPDRGTATEPAMGAVVDDLTGAVRAVEAQFLLIAISGTKHHALAEALQQRWRDGGPSPIVILVGASPEFHLGLVPRAPRWMRRTGLEWFHRLLLDPRRMARRYLVDDMVFGRIVWDEWRHRR